MPANTSPKRRPSRTANRRSKMLQALPAKTRPGLALDTSVSRHRAPAPQQIFPYESRTQELSFISLADIKALKKKRSVDKARQMQLSNEKLYLAPRSFPGDGLQQNGHDDKPPPYSSSETAESVQAPALHKRIKGLRPTPLDLSTDISPSDRAITIGLSVDHNAVPRHSRTPSSPVAAQLYETVPRRRPSEKHTGQEVVTPTIVITPAREDFDFGLDPQASPEANFHRAKGHRPTSSVYSRYTNCMPVNGSTPPVPPLPLFAVGKASKVRDSTGTVFEEEARSLRVPKRGRAKNLSVCTVFEEDQPTTTAQKRLTSQSSLPTPRRSRGWWNLITSPFSGSAKSNAYFWRSPPPDEDGSRSRMLDDAADMGSDQHAGIMFTNRTLEDIDLRSAPPVDPQRSSFNGSRPRQLKRSDTAPGALDPNGQDGVNIYTIPWVGAAADYYNPHKNFPSTILSPENMDRAIDGWSPSHSVYRGPRSSVKGVVANVDDAENDSDDTFIDDNPFDDQHGAPRALEDEKSPFSDAHASNAFEDFSGTHPAATAEKKFFSTPETEELRGASPAQPVRPEPTRNETQATMESHFSPLTATPIIEDARMGTLMGPSLVDVRSTPSRSATPQSSGIGAVTMASRSADDDERAVPEKRPFQHQRNDSYGLGIDTDTESMSEKSLFPPPKPLAQQPRLGTDRFGQLRIEKDSDREPDWSPWYQRFLWPLLGVAAALLILLVVLLVLFVSQSHDDMPVQARWLNLTGFPPMPTGVATVVQPSKHADVGGCVQPADLWSCAVPDGMNDSGDGAPNFRFEIRFRNKTRSDMNSTDLTPSSGAYKRSMSGASLASDLMKRSAWTDSLFASLPAPPSIDELIFLGNTTDGVSEPLEGEETPFYISLLNASALEAPHTANPRLRKRERGDGVYPYPTSSSDSDSNNTSSDHATHGDNDASASNSAATDAATSIPRPYLQPNGSPAPAQLYPLAHAQPLRLYNRGQADEHYGFSTFFDRSLYLRTSAAFNITTATNASFAAITSNTPLPSSNAVCAFSQTRLHVQIWTRRPLLTSLSTDSDEDPAAADSSADALTPPGSFPYEVTVTLDRHGGQADRKGVYCYGLDGEGRVMQDSETWVPEERGFGGGIVGAAAVPGGMGKRDGSSGEMYEGKGIDGGDGGCACEWRSGR